MDKITYNKYVEKWTRAVNFMTDVNVQLEKAETYVTKLVENFAALNVRYISVMLFCRQDTDLLSHYLSQYFSQVLLVLDELVFLECGRKIRKYQNVKYKDEKYSVDVHERSNYFGVMDVRERDKGNANPVLLYFVSYDGAKYIRKTRLEEFAKDLLKMKVNTLFLH